MSKSEARTLRELAAELAQTMQCNCDLDSWQPEPATGHSWVCRIHKGAVSLYGEQQRRLEPPPPAWTTREPPAEPPPAPNPAKPVAYLHALHMEGGQMRRELTFDARHPFGVRGRDFSRSYAVTTIPLYANLPAFAAARA